MEHEFVLIGSGTSTGVPMPGCGCAVCSSTNPRNFRNRTAGFVKFKSGATLLVDATTDLRHQCLQHHVKNVDAVLFTHAHSDHIGGTDDLRVFNFLSKRAIDCYGSAETLDGVRTMFPYIFKRDPSYQGGFIAQLTLNEIDNHVPFTVAGATIHPFPLPHGNVTVTGFRVGDLGYATDCKGLSPRAYEVLHGVNTLFLDGLRWEQHRTHNTIEEAIEIATKVKAKRTFLIHLTHAVDHDEVSARLPSGVELGYDGLSVTFRCG